MRETKRCMSSMQMVGWVQGIRANRKGERPRGNDKNQRKSKANREKSKARPSLRLNSVREVKLEVIVLVK